MRNIHFKKFIAVFTGIMVILVFFIGPLSQADEGDYTDYAYDTGDAWAEAGDGTENSWDDTSDTSDYSDDQWVDAGDTQDYTDDSWDYSDEAWYDTAALEAYVEETTAEEETSSKEQETTEKETKAEEKAASKEDEKAGEAKEEIKAPVPDPAAIKDYEREKVAYGDYYIRNIASSYVYFAAPEVEAANIPLVAKTGVDPEAFEGENGEELVNNLQMEILGEDLLPVHIEPDEEGYAILSIGDTGKVLGLAGSLRDGVNVMAVDRAPAVYPAPTHGRLREAIDGQRWIIDQQDDGTVLIRSAADSSYMMTLDDRYGIHYANLMLWEETGGKNQKFLFSRETPKVASSSLEEGTYFIRTGMNGWSLLSIGDDIYDDDRDIYIWESDQGDGQIFTVEYDDYGFAIIHHNESSKVLTVRGNEAVDGQAIGQCEYDGDNWQRWIIADRKDGGYNILSALNTSEVMNLVNGSVRNGNEILLYWRDGSTEQQWFFHTEPVITPSFEERWEAFANEYSSDSNYLILVDTYSCIVGVFQGSKGNWKNLYVWDCVTGKPGTPTPHGEFVVYDKVWSFDGNEDSPVWYTVYYATEFLPTYFFHSIIYYQGTFDILDATMGWNASHGCIRLYTENAEWIYNNIPWGTKVVIY